MSHRFNLEEKEARTVEQFCASEFEPEQFIPPEIRAKADAQTCTRLSKAVRQVLKIVEDGR